MFMLPSPTNIGKLNMISYVKNHALKRKNLSILTTILIIWIMEWLLIIEYIFGEWWRTSIIIPVKTPLGLSLCFLYWIYLWGMATWRRTQFGKFTRGERKLWAKAITAFWVVELVTLVSFILIYLWLSWGPAPLVPRTFLVSRKSIIIELVLFSYIIFLAYIAKLSLKWNLWRYQLYLSLIIVIIFSYLLWKDILLLLLRDNLSNNSNARWKNIRLTAVVYSLSHEWWTTHLMGARTPQANFISLDVAFNTRTHPFKSPLPVPNEYMQNSIIPNITLMQRTTKAFPVLSYLYNFTNDYKLPTNMYLHETIYPRRTGYLPKRLTMWQLVMILKMWHHLIILLWWTLYVYKLLYRRKTAYTALNVCYFNVYCCYLLALIVYLLYYVACWELFLKFRPNIFNLRRFIRSCDHAISYNTRLLISAKEDGVAQFWYLISFKKVTTCGVVVL